MVPNLKALIGKLNRTTRLAMENAAGLCLSRANYHIELQHLLHGLLSAPHSDFNAICAAFEIDRSIVADAILLAIEKLERGNAGTPDFSSQLIRILSSAWLIASLNYDSRKIRSAHILMAVLADSESARLLSEISSNLRKIDPARLVHDLPEILRTSSEDHPDELPHLVTTPAINQPPAGPRVFISYRRDDGYKYADFLFMALLSGVPGVNVFHDTDTLKPGMVFSDMLTETLDSCDVLLAVIGKKWAGRSKAGEFRRIDEPDDWVRREIATALEQNKLVIPCLIDGASMPASDSLPPELIGLARRQAARLSEKNFRHDASALAERINTWYRSR